MSKQLLLQDWPIEFSSVTQPRPTLCYHMDCSMPGLPVYHQIPEVTQIHAHWVSDAIQTSHPLSSPSPPHFNLSQHQGLFNESALCIRWPKYWSFSFNISQLFASGDQSIGVSASTSVLPMNTQDWSPLGWTGWISLQSKRFSRVFSNTTVQKH